MPKRGHYLFVCVNRRPDGNLKGSCAQKGSEAIYEALRKELAARGINRTVARACSSSCLDMCKHGPSICVEPQHVLYGGVTLEDVPEIIAAIESGIVVQRLIVADDEPETARRG